MGNFINELKEYQDIPRQLVFDKSLSDRARFVYIFMACKPDDWDFYLEPMAKDIGYSVDTLRKYINELVREGWLIKGEQQKENGLFGAVQYTLKATNFSDTEKLRHGEFPTLHNKDNIHKQDCNILSKERKNKKKEKTSFDLSFVMPDFLPIVQDWFAYKKEKKQTYKERGAKTFCTQLVNLSDNNPEIARLIIEQSMANNWAGIFPLKNKPKTQPMPKCQEQDEVVIGGQTYK